MNDGVNTTLDLDAILDEAFNTPEEPQVEQQEGPIERIPVNVPYVDETVSRFSSAVWFDYMGRIAVTLAGLGGIGSYVAFLIGRLRPLKMYLYDPDVVDNTNISGQLYSTQQVGESKVSSMGRLLANFSNFHRVVTDRSLYPVGAVTDITICGFDNMRARRDAFLYFKHYMSLLPENERYKYLFIDGRLAAEEFQVFCMTGEDAYLMKKYEEEWLFSDDDAEETICSYKQTSFCANMIGSVIVNLVVNFVTNLCDDVMTRELPFMVSYNAELMKFDKVFI